MSEFEDQLKSIGEIGSVVSINRSIISVSGLPGLKTKEAIVTESGARGMAYSLGEDVAEVFMFDTEKLRVGERVARTNEIFKIPVNKNLLGRIVDPFCRPIDGLGPIKGEKVLLDIERQAPPVFQRIRVNRFLETGTTIVDLLAPIGYGQRELIIGDGKTGKTTFLLQTVLSQVNKGIVCIYVSVGKEVSQVKMTEEYLKKAGVFENVIMVVARSNNLASTIFLAPYSAMTIAEFFRENGIDTIVIFDDLTTHAKIYREISLLLKRFPGRSVYPGDIFHVQAALLERAGNILGKGGKEVSITAFPVAEILNNDIADYIPTNLMAMTDGHIFFDIEEFKKGRRPAINAFLSVSRIGNQTKGTVDRQLASLVRRRMIEHHRVLGLVQFGVELPPETKELIDFGEKVLVLFSQSSKRILSRGLQLVLFGLLLSGFWDNKTPEVMEVIIEEILRHHEKGRLSEIERGVEELKNLEELRDFTGKIVPQINQLYRGNIKENK